MGWQPIETAPRGTWVDLWAAERDRYENSRITDCIFYEGRWIHHRTIYDEETMDDLVEVYHPTHWMPKPSAPTQSTMERDDG